MVPYSASYCIKLLAPGNSTLIKNILLKVSSNPNYSDSVIIPQFQTAHNCMTG